MRVRVRFHKTEAMRYTGHLDLHKAWERTIRRARLPLAYSQGFHPQPRLNLACALPLGFTSACEMADMWFEGKLEIKEISANLEKALPPGIRIQSLESVPDNAPKLPKLVHSAEYTITLLEGIPKLSERIAKVIEMDSLSRVRRNKPYDLRPLIESVAQLPNDDEDHQRIHVRLAARAGATGRPEELVAALGGEPTAARYHRTNLVFDDTKSPVHG